MGESVEKQKFTDIIRGVQHAASTAAAVAVEHFRTTLEQHFDKGIDGTYTPKFITIKLGGQSVNVPTIALYQHRSVLLKRLRVEMSIRIDEASVKDLENKLSRSSFTVQFVGADEGKRGNSVVSVMAEFEDADPPEGYARLVDDILNRYTALHGSTTGN